MDYSDEDFYIEMPNKLSAEYFRRFFHDDFSGDMGNFSEILANWMFSEQFLKLNNDKAQEIAQTVLDKMWCPCSSAGFILARNVLADVVRNLEKITNEEKDISGLLTGWEDIDRLTTGLQPGDVILVVGEHQVGKTSFALNIAEHAAITEEKSVAVFSLELPINTLCMRMISSQGGIDQSRLCVARIEDEEDKLVSAITRLNNKKIYFYSEQTITTKNIVDNMNKLVSECNKIDLMVIDGVHLLKNDIYHEKDILASVFIELKMIAEKYNIPVVATLPLSIETQNHIKINRVKIDLQKIESILPHTDMVIFIYRDSLLKEKEADKMDIAEIVIAKQKNGLTGTVLLGFQGQYLRFVNLAPQQYADYGEE